MTKSLDTTLRTVTKAGEGRLFLLVLREGSVSTFELPPEGRITIGRSEECDIRIDDASISRKHAVLHCGQELRLEDLGSANGSTVGDVVLQGGGSTGLSASEPALLGSVTIVVQRRRHNDRSIRVWSYDYFEARVREECARSAAGSGELSVLRLQVPAEQSPQVVQGPLARAIRDYDVVGLYAPGRYEILLTDRSATEVSGVAKRLNQELAKSGLEGELTIRHFPKEFRDAEALLAHEVLAADDSAPIVQSASMRKLYDLAGLIAAGDISVLILGETGVGKQVLAESLHASSPRSEGTFLELNCSAFSESLLESELFGHEKGAFTGASRSKKGLFESADGGTVFLDEIGEMPPSLQAKLLRVLENREVLRIGSLEPVKVDVRFIGATNRDIEAEVAEGRFREDLYFRIAGATLEVPPLRERIDEIPAVARRFLDRFAKRPLVLSDDAIDSLKGYSWPGNLRELRNVMERASLLATAGEVTPEHLPMQRFQSTMSPRASSTGKASAESAAAEKRQRILDALASCGGNNSQAAEVLGVSRRTLGTWMDQLGIARPRKSNR